MIGKRFRRAGWTVAAKEAGDRCPACSASAAPTAKFPKDLPMIKTPSAGASPAAAPAVLPDAPPAIVPSLAVTNALALYYMAMVDAYDRAAGAYRPGWSDERVAKETGLSLAEVTRRRTSDFPPLPPEVDPLKDAEAALVDLRADTDKVTSACKVLHALADRQRAGIGRLEAALAAARKVGTR
jgi:hypothetical protein